MKPGLPSACVLAAILPACAAPAPTPTVAAVTPDSSTHARREVSCSARVDRLIDVSGTHALIEGSDGHGAGLYWVDLASGALSAAYPKDLPAARRRVVSASREGEVTYVVMEDGDSDRPVRKVIALDAAARTADEVTTGGNWSAVAIHDGALTVAGRDRVYSVGLAALRPAAPQGEGERVFNETRWMTWIGDTLVSAMDDSTSLVVWRDGDIRRIVQIGMTHPARVGNEVVGYVSPQLMAWSPSNTNRLVIDDFGLRFGELVAPVSIAGSHAYALTPRWLLSLDLALGAVHGVKDITGSDPNIDERSPLVPSVVADGHGAWTARTDETCNRGGLARSGERLLSQSRCVPSSRLMYWEDAAFDPAPSADPTGRW